MSAQNEGQKSLIKSIEHALSVDATNTQISVNAQIIDGITELLINKGLLSKEEVLTMIEAKKQILVSRYTENKQRFEMIDGLDIYESMIFEINTTFNHFKEKVESV
jgi:DNA-directed RNA polymerase specialized sigma subunit